MSDSHAFLLSELSMGPISLKILYQYGGYNVLHIATRRNALECMRVALDNGALVGDVTRHGQTCLHLAKSKQAALMLIKAGADVNCEDYKGLVPLHTAAIDNNLEVMKVLVESGADLGRMIEDGENIISRLTLSPDPKIVNYINAMLWYQKGIWGIWEEDIISSYLQWLPEEVIKDIMTEMSESF